jgi:chromosome segregation protein
MAYVTMTLVDPDVYRENAGHKLQPVEGGHPPKNAEVTITRRLYRSGESEYLIDGRAARLRDIQDIFMGTGLGPESYAIIEQGRIGQILSSKPQDRRGVIEEAAGITKFKTRKRLAEAKLEGAKQNLARVYDILEEVTRQVNSLKRQAGKAKRFGELKIELDARLRVVLGGKYRLLERDAAKTAIDLNFAASELKSLGDQVAEREQAHEVRQTACYEVESQLTEARRQLAERQVEAERIRGRLASQVQESGSIEQRIAQNEKDAHDLGLRLDALDEEIGGHKKNVEALEGEIATARQRMTEINQQREGLQFKVRERERAIENGRQVILRLLGEASTLKNQLAQIEEYLAGIDRETARATREETVAASEIERIDIARKQLSETVAQRQMELEAVTGERRRTEQELADRRRLAGELRREIDGMKTEVSQIRARKESLEQVLAHRTYTTESVKRLFASLEKGKADDLKPLGVLADYVEVDPQFEKPAEEFLHEELEYVVVQNWQQAERGLDFIRA